MSKIQGKQIENLLIGTPSDDSYTGVFSLDPTTKVADAVDKINDILGKLAPPAPSTIWTNTFTAFTLSGGLTGRMVNTTTDYTGVIYNTPTPTISVTSTFTTPLAEATAKALPPKTSPLTTLGFSLSDNIHTNFETLNIQWDSTSASSSGGRITYTVGDPYLGTVGKLGIWTGITSITLSGTIPSTPTPITASTTKNTLTFAYPGSGIITRDFYVDDSSTPTISNITLSGTLNRYVSGVPSLIAGAALSLGFKVTSAVSYFYNNNLFDISNTNSNTYIVTQSNKPPQSTPQAHGDIITIAEHVVLISDTSKYSETITLGIKARSVSAASTIYTATPASALRIDTVSNETLRFLSGWGTWDNGGTFVNTNGSYPDSVYGNLFVSTNVLNPSTPNDYSHELMLINGVYKYPSGNFTAYTDSNTLIGPNYNNNIGTATRWATFKFANFGTVDSKKSSFILTTNGLSGVPPGDFTNSNLLIEAKVDGAGESTWVNCTKYFEISTNPGYLVNDIGGCLAASASISMRTINFGSYPHYGTLYIRIGVKYNSGITFTGVSIS